ncbi:hypothetical protein TI05_12720 [Achromatium sp. WMS3]|nr:hypothetical protein TI05_12720 [Achromatium sp. WMS3]
MTKLVILDRDGVINEDSPKYIKSPEEWIPIPGSLEAIARLNHSGFKVVVATNQSGIARGLFSLEQLNAIHQKMRQALERVGGHVEGIFFCPHTPEHGCDCRKPRSGLINEIKKRLNFDISKAYMIGDSYRDLQTAWIVGAKAILVKTGNGNHTQAQYDQELSNTKVYSDLANAAKSIVQEHYLMS